MGRKKTPEISEITNGQQTPSTTSSSPQLLPASKAPNGPSSASQAQSSVLNISRNKHWRFISAFHGPWLQLPPELLETLAHGNYLAPRPRQTDPAVLYDLTKIRKLVDEASNLAVRAQNGTASSALRDTENGHPGSSLGLMYGNGGGNAKLSPERKYRMRELATQKLAQAYRLDEIAASVATMQGASSLATVAGLVLQRNPNNMDAKYVHFFHEKIPSRTVAESTPLTPLNEIIAHNPAIAATLRTKGLTNVFKEDHLGAIKDFTEALIICRLDQQKHLAGKNQLVTAKDARAAAERRKIWSKDWLQQNRVSEEDQPRGMEMQLLFQRGNQHLTMACQYIKTALDYFRGAKETSEQANGTHNDHNGSTTTLNRSEISHRKGLEAREIVRKYAKRALKDYTTFFSRLDYAHAPPHQAHESIFRRDRLPEGLEDRTVEELDDFSLEDSSSQALVEASYRSRPSNGRTTSPSPPPAISVHDIATVLSSSPPTDLPTFPTPSETAQQQELITYHPLLLETLHSLLLAHCILQTPPTSLHRHAINAARIARLADGYPFFLAARSPARSDWTEILRKLDNWINLPCTWDKLCRTSNIGETSHRSRRNKPSRAPSSSSGPSSSNSSVTALAKPTADTRQDQQQEESSQQRASRIHKEAVMDALGDDRVMDDASFHRSVQARERRAWQEIERFDHVSNGDAAQGKIDTAAAATTCSSASMSRNGSHEDRGADDVNCQKSVSVARDEEYLIGTERANVIAQWVREAPAIGETPGLRPRKGKKKSRASKVQESVNERESEVAA